MKKLTSTAIFGLLVSLSTAILAGQTYTFSTLAGVAPGSADGTGDTARFFSPEGVAVDGAGNVYVADTDNHTIRKITPGGVVTTFAGSAGNPGWTNGTGSAARFKNPHAVAVDGVGNVYVADTGNFTIRKITPAGEVTTIAGHAGIPGAPFDGPYGIAVDNAGTIYVTQVYTTSPILKVTAAGEITTLVGSNAGIGSPFGVAVDGAGNLFVADAGNHVIRKVTPAGVITTFAGTVGVGGVTDGTGSTAKFSFPYSVAVDSSNNVYVGDASNRIRRITAAGDVTTFFDGAFRVTDGTMAAGIFNVPMGVAVDNAGNLYVAESGSSAIRQITPAGEVTTLAGTVSPGHADGIGALARFKEPRGVAADDAGNVYVADTGNRIIRKITAAGVVTTFAGTAGTSGSDDGTGSAARFGAPFGVAMDGAGNLYVADTSNHTIRKITSAGMVTTLAGSTGSPGSADGTGNAAQFNGPYGVAVDGAGTIYVADTGNRTIRKITAEGVVTTFAGTVNTSGTAYSTDGTGAAASFVRPNGLAVDTAGNVYVADNDTIREITPTGVVTTFAGYPGGYGYASAVDGTGQSATFSYPTGVAVDGAGNLFVADCYSNTVRKITPDRVVTTVAGVNAVYGSSSTFGSADGAGVVARFYLPYGVAVDNTGNVYVADTSNNTIRKGVTLDVIPVNFSVAGYLSRNPDVAAVFGSDQYGAWLHYRDTGINEGRVFDEEFRVDEYLGMYGDLQAAFGTDRKSALLHWLIAGKAEHRLGRVPVAFDAAGYLARYGDLQAAFGGLPEGSRQAAAWGHYLVAGVYEGRTDGDFDAREYLAAYADLRAAFGTELQAAALHWYIGGRYEGRRIPAGFNLQGYLARNPDVAAVYGSDLYGAWLHYRNTGINEGRVFDDEFRVDEYLGMYGDLRAAFGTDREAALLHWFIAGKAEHRLGRVPITFNAANYLARYGDLQAAFGGLPERSRQAAAWEHYLVAGVYEGRTDGDFDAQQYLAMYGDLQAAYGTDLQAAALHWYIAGRYEGRRIPTGFNVSGYLSRNPDLAAVYGPDLYGAWLHCRDTGINEGRVFDDEFRVDEYLALYPDLQAAFGTNRTAALMHWLTTGKAEGRFGRFP